MGWDTNPSSQKPWNIFFFQFILSACSSCFEFDLFLWGSRFKDEDQYLNNLCSVEDWNKWNLELRVSRAKCTYHSWFSFKCTFFRYGSLLKNIFGWIFFTLNLYKLTAEAHNSFRQSVGDVAIEDSLYWNVTAVGYITNLLSKSFFKL